MKLPRLVLAAVVALLCASPAMADTTLSPTTLVQPLVGGSSNTWGATINANYTTINSWFGTGPALNIANGGTSATTAAGALIALGAASLSTINTFALTQTFTVAPVFSDASGTRSALSLGSAALLNTSGVLQPSNNLSDLGAASTARTNLGLGTSATVNTGTSGGTIPLLNSANTWSNQQTLQGTTIVGTGASLTAANAVFTVDATSGSNAAQFMVEATDDAFTILVRSDRIDAGPFQFMHGASTTVGSVTTTATTTAYNTTSDYRLKTNVTPLTGALDRLELLRPVRFNWKANLEDAKVDGFIAHEVTPAVPEAVHGVKDAVNADGSINPQQLDYSKIVPLLVASVQELDAKVKALQAKVERLEAANDNAHRQVHRRHAG